jgi:hypothetical protein
MTLVPAYGRDYKSRAAALADFEAGRDFRIASVGPDIGRYVNRSQLVEAGIREVSIRYARLARIAMVEVRP